MVTLAQIWKWHAVTCHLEKIKRTLCRDNSESKKLPFIEALTDSENMKIQVVAKGNASMRK